MPVFGDFAQETEALAGFLVVAQVLRFSQSQLPRWQAADLISVAVAITDEAVILFEFTFACCWCWFRRRFETTLATQRDEKPSAHNKNVLQIVDGNHGARERGGLQCPANTRAS